MSPHTNIDIDIAIIGGGVAGLWLLNRLRGQGFSAALFESRALGSGQSINTQGIIHGGLKYALSGVFSAGASALAEMPATWRACLKGSGSVDLRGCEVLSEQVYLWSTGGLPSRLTSLLASRLLHGRVERLDPDVHPTPFDSGQFQGQLYQLEDFVIDANSLIECLASPQRDYIFSIGSASSMLTTNKGGAELQFANATVRPRRLLLCAGAGNAALLQQLGSAAPTMQVRPLTQVLLKGSGLPSLYGHCLGKGSSPRLTVSTHKARDGDNVWYLGGDLATVEGLSPEARIARAREELAATLPWLDTVDCDWRTITLDRAEPGQANRQKPDSVFLGPASGIDNTLVAWPTKLALCPALGDALVQQLDEEDFQPRHQPDLSPLAGLKHPRCAQPCWETLFP